jgi:hypothetical protein
VPSLEPLYSEQDLVFGPDLIGVWEAADDPSREPTLTWTFERGEGNAYRLTIREGEASAAFDAHLLRLGEATYLDFFPVVPPDCVPVPADESGFPESAVPVLQAVHFVPVHSFWRVLLDGDDMQVAALSPDWLGRQLEQGRVRINHKPYEDEHVILLTAPTADLQQLIHEHADDPEAFAEPLPLRRQIPK